MSNYVYQLGSLGLGVFVLSQGLACWGKENISEPSSNIATSSSLHNLAEDKNSQSEGRIGPDDLFFAEQYISLLASNSRQLAQAAASEVVKPNPVKSSGASLEFTANYSSARLELMSKLLLQDADKDGDGAVSEEEFVSLQWSPKNHGGISEASDWQFGREVFRKLADGEAQVQAEQLKSWLASMGPLLQKQLESAGEQSQRLGTVKAWEAVLAHYDVDKDGRLNRSEQQALRAARNKLLPTP